MRRILAVVVVLLAMAGRAEAVTLRELVELSRAGLSDDVLIALVEADKSSFALAANDIRELKKAGLSDKVLLHLIRTPELRRLEQRAEEEEAARRQPPPVTVIRAETPRRGQRPVDRVVVIDRVETIAVPVAVPVYVPVDDRPSKPPKDEKPEYWGHGGKLRPDAWGQPVKRDK